MNYIEVWHYFWQSLGCFFNALLIFIAIFKSPKAIQTYATLIVNFAATDFCECFFYAFTQIRLLPSPGGVTMTYIFNGFCKYFGDFSCKIGASLFIHCLPHAVYSLLLSFGYRFYILKRSSLTRRTLIMIIVAFYTPSFIQAVTFWRNFVERDEILPLATKIYPNYNFSQETGVISGIVDITSPLALYGISQATLPIFPVYTIIFVLRRKIVAHLVRSSNMMTKETKAIHTQLLRALTYQAFIPAFLWVGATCYLISQLGIIQQSPPLEYSVFITGMMMPILSPFTYFLFVRPYKQFCLRLFYIVTRQETEKKTKISRFESTNVASQIGTVSKTTVA